MDYDIWLLKRKAEYGTSLLAAESAQKTVQ